MIKVIDYGLGNIRAFVNIYESLNIPVMTVSRPDQLTPEDKFILPGVGTFDSAMKRLEKSGMIEVLNELVLSKGCPILGVCVGMQIMGAKSDEGELGGLNWIPGIVRKISTTNLKRLPQLPHLGWNSVTPYNGDCIFKNIASERFYFLHSYQFEPENTTNALAYTNYGSNFVSSIRKSNIYGVQFHPEKSHDSGVHLLKNFAEL